MGVLEFFKVYIFGEEFQIQDWSVQNWLITTYRIGILLIGIIITYYLQLLIYMLEWLKNSRFVIKFDNRLKSCLYYIPILGRLTINLMNQFDNFMDEKLLPFLHTLNQLLPIMVHTIIVKMCFVENPNVKMFYTQDSDDILLFSDNQLLTTLLISNHRSLNDYFLLTYIIIYKNACIKENDTLTDIFFKLWECQDIRNKIQFEFLSWGSIYSLPNWELFKNIILKDENIVVSGDAIKNSIQTKGEGMFILFPEVNILTTELAIIQRKLNQDYYPFVNKYYNVLSPRFQQFINTIHGFKEVINSTLNKNGPNKKCFFRKKKSSTANEELISEDNLVLFNKFLYDITIIYYTPKLVSNGHNHDTGNFKTINGVQIEETNPSFFKLFQSKNITKSTTPPIIIVIDVKKHAISPILLMNDKKLEKWVELQWVRKENLINHLHSEVTLQ